MARNAKGQGNSTRREKGGGTIRQRPDGTWEARYTVGRDPGTGKQKQKSIYGKTQKEVRQKLTAVLAAIDKGIYTEPSKMTVGQWLDTWLSDYTGGIKEQTRTQYEQVCRIHLKPSFGAVALLALKPPAIQRLYNKLIEKGRSPKTVKNVNGVFHKALQQAVLLQFIPVNPCDAVQLPKAVKPDLCVLNEEKISEFLTAIKGSEYENILRVDLFTGLRQGEIMGLTWDRVDFEAGTILIDRQLIRERKKNGLYKFASTKTEKGRKLKPAPFVMDILKEVRKQQLEDKLRAGELWNDGGFPGLVFTNHFGQHFGRTTLTSNVSKIGESIGVPGFRFHDLRHTYAVASIRAGDDLKTISSNLGHATIAITMDVYAKYTSDMMNASSDRMEAYAKRFLNL